MIPLLYDKLGTTKLGDLNNCIECLVEEERNGLFELSLVYPVSDIIFNSLEEDNIIIANANDTLLNQKFRIYNTRKLMDNEIEVLARHISFDLVDDIVNNIDITNQSCEYALNTIFRSSQFSQHYRGFSDIINAQNYKISMCNCLEAIAGKEGSIIDTYGTGAEILRDNTNIYVKNRRGNDNLVTIEYAKNLTGFELEEDTTDLITRIIPYAKYNDSTTNKEVLVKGNAVDSTYINNYSHPHIRYIDYSDKFEDNETPTVLKLETFARNDFRDNKVDIPKQNYKIEFIPLSKCVGYEGLQDKISLCDTVTVIDTRYGINTKAKVIKTKFNVLKNRYESMELGEPRTTLGDIIGGSGQDGKPGPPGPQGPPGADGNIGDFPNSLPTTPILSHKVYGFSTIELSWTFENKVYYQYELYASKTKDFTPNVFDLIHAGQTSSFLFQAEPNETWYFKVCCLNSHGNRTAFSKQIAVTTKKIDDLSNYFESAAIGKAVVGTLNADYMTAGIIKGNWIDMRHLTLTDGNGKRVIDIDDFGRAYLDIHELRIKGENAASKADVQLTADNLTLKFEQQGDNLLLNSKPYKSSFSTSPWSAQQTNYNFPSGWQFAVVNTIWTGWEDGFEVYTPTLGPGMEIGMYQEFETTVGQTYRVTGWVAGLRSVKYAWIRGSATNEWAIIKDAGAINSYGGKGNADDHSGWYRLDMTFVAQRDKTKINLGMRALYDIGDGVGAVNGFLWAKQLKVTANTTANPVWTPNPREIQAGVFKAGVDGFEVIHADGAKTQLNPTALNFFDGSGNLYSKVKGGQLRFNNNSGSEVGYMGRGVWTGTSNYLTSVAALYGSTVGIGSSKDPGNNNIYIPLVVSGIDTNIGTSGVAKVGVNLYDYLNMAGNTIRYYADANMNANYASVSYASTSEYLCHFGNAGLILGVRQPSGNKNIIKLTNTGVASPQANLDVYTHLNMNNWTIQNSRSVSTLDATTPYSKSLTKGIRDIYGVMSCTDGDIRYTDRQTYTVTKTLDGNLECYVELPYYLAENLENAYHVNISKRGFGDYYIKEVNPYYFILEADREGFAFTFEVVGKIIEKPTCYSIIANRSIIDNEEPENSVPSYKENNEYWRLYKC